MRPGYLAGVAGLLAVVVGAFAWFGLRESQRALLESMQSSALSMAAAVSRAGENALRADAELEYLVSERLLDAGRRVLAGTDLSEAGDESTRLDLFDADGALEASSDPEGMDPLEQEWWWQACLDLGLHDYGEILIGEDVAATYAVAVARPAGGAVLVRGDATPLLELRRTTGIGRLIQELSSNPGLVYAVLQDTSGILVASRSVSSLSTVDDDPFLRAALETGDADTRLATHEGVEVLETVLAFVVEEQEIGLLRIAQPLDDLRDLEARQRLQLLLVAGLVLAIGAIGVTVVTVRQNYALLDAAYERVQTYSSTLLERLGDAVIAADADGCVEIFNAAAEALFGRPRSEVIGRHFRDGLGDCEPLVAALEQGEELQAATFQLRGDAGTRTVSATSAQVPGGEAQTVVVVLQDQTERQALTADLQRRERLASMGALAAGVAHEVRNPLNTIGLIAQRLQKEFEPREGAADYERMTATARDEVKRVNRIIGDFLALARPPSIEWAEVDIDELLAAAAAAIEARAAVQSLQLTVEGEAKGTIEADRDQLLQVLQNLLGNAIEATPAGGSVALRTADGEDGWITLAVCDTGKGIPPAERERIFDLYFTTKAEGTGLGLSLVQRIVAEHGGRLQVDSDEGVGTTMTVSLPRQRPAAA
jgi:PAS domain S-box-containing protein